MKNLKTVDSMTHIKVISCILNRIYFTLQFIRTYIHVYYRYGHGTCTNQLLKIVSNSEKIITISTY